MSQSDLVLGLGRLAVVVFETELEAIALQRVRADRGILFLESHLGTLLFVEDEVVSGVDDRVAGLKLDHGSSPRADDRGRLQEAVVNHVAEETDDQGTERRRSREHALVERITVSCLLFLGSSPKRVGNFGPFFSWTSR